MNPLNKMKLWALALGAVIAVTCAANDARIEEIAQGLPETPRADGAPASDRAK